MLLSCFNVDKLQTCHTCSRGSKQKQVTVAYDHDLAIVYVTSFKFIGHFRPKFDFLYCLHVICTYVNLCYVLGILVTVTYVMYKAINNMSIFTPSVTCIFEKETQVYLTQI